MELVFACRLEPITRQERYGDSALKPGTDAVANRIPAFALVVAAHAVGFYVLLTITRMHRLVSEPEETPVLVVLLPAHAAVQLKRTPETPAPRAAPPRLAPRVSEGSAPAPSEPPPASHAIPWAAEAQAAAARQADQDATVRRQAAALSPPHSRGFAPPGRKPQFHWYHARAHRVEPIEGGGLVINLNDSCALVVLGLVPLPTCRLGKVPARGDLFEHMRDPPVPGSWKDR